MDAVKKKNDLLAYPAVKLLFPLILGIAAGDAADITPAWCWAALACSVVFAAAAYRRKYLQTLLLLAAVFLTGATSVSVKKQALLTRFPDRMTTFKAVLLANPATHGKVVQTDLMIMYGERPIKAKASILRDTATCRYQSLHIGDGIEACAFLETPASIPGTAFDHARWMRLHGYSAEVFIRHDQWRKAKVGLRGMGLLQRTALAAAVSRQQLMKQLAHNLDGSNLAIVSAMALGDRQFISKDTKEDYSLTGTSHVLALSGLHLTIVYGLLMLLTGWCGRLLPGRTGKAASRLLTLTAVWGYVVLTGMPASVVRSAAMLTLYTFVTLLNREKLSVNTLALTAVIMLIINPFNLFDIGFQLSFLSVWAIMLFYPLIYEAVSLPQTKTGLPLRWLWGMVAVSVAAQLGTAPLIAFYFGRVSTLFAAGSLIAVPGTMVIVSAAICMLLLAPFPALSSLAGRLICTTAEGLNTALHWLAGLPGASIGNLHVTVFQLLVYYVMLTAVWLLWTAFAGKTSLAPEPATWSEVVR